ncbi:MAG: hypothetical protein GYA47_01655, partial [Desulfovibrio sp.]|nr:hypothetical protein [Desulfovibrio sp.]
MTHSIKTLMAGFVLVLLLPAAGLAGTPKEALQNSVDQVIILLRDPAYRNE